MGAFPKLKTLAVMQYPAEKRLQASTQVLRFLDGSEQRFRLYERPLHQWVIRLDLLDSSEWAAIEAFVISMQGRAGAFSFTDPWDSAEYPDCSFEADDVRIHLLGEQHAQVSVIIRENLI